MKEEPQLSEKFVFQRLGYRHQGIKNSWESNTLPKRKHDTWQGKSPSERQVAKVNVKEGVTTPKITIMNQGNVKNGNT